MSRPYTQGVMRLPPPSAFGLPSKFSEWRPHQDRACESIVDSPSRFVVQVCPTGFGKSVTYMTASQLTPGRTVVLTSTKGLQSQLMQDFGMINKIVDIRGRANYSCRLNPKARCDEGPCAFGVKCNMKTEGGCLYYDQLHKAKAAEVVITNYAYWMTQNEYSEGIGEFGMLVLDEAHSSPDHVIDHISISFSKRYLLESTVLGLRNSLPNDILGWQTWASDRLGDVRSDMKDAKEKRKDKLWLRLKRLEGKLSRLEERIDSTWLWEDGSATVTLSPIWVDLHTESVLFLGIPKVLLTSATVVPKTVKLLGVKDHHYEEYPHSFPVENRPLIHLPTVRMNHRIGEMEHRLWTNKVDQIIRDRLEHKGIIHTVSYARRDIIIERSKYSEYMITHTKATTESVVRSFKRSEAPCILVSPSMATGWDFPDEECRWQIIVKLPYPDTRGDIIKARSRKDSDFSAYIVMQQLIQATGRGVRNLADYCETFVIDNNITWFIKKYDHLSVGWFMEAYRVRAVIPPPTKRGDNHGQ